MTYNIEDEDINEIREPAVAYGKTRFTVEEYLAMDNASLEKHEYYQGEIFTMTGGTRQHSFLFKNMYGPLAHHLKGKTCMPFGSDTRVQIPENTLITYPDISIFCEDVTEPDGDDELYLFKRPTDLIELLSPSTKNYDRGKKFELYQDIPTLKQYIMIDSQSVCIEAWLIDASGRWNLTKLTSKKEILTIPSIEFSISVEDVYERVRFNHP